MVITSEIAPMGARLSAKPTPRPEMYNMPEWKIAPMSSNMLTAFRSQEEASS